MQQQSFGSQEASVDLGPMLRKRLEEKKAERTLSQAKIQRQSGQLQKLLNSASSKNRRRDTVDQLDAQIRQLERRRTTQSLKLSEEKQILRQIEGIERMKKQEHEIKQIKDELTTSRELLRETNVAIAELEAALSKVDLAAKLGCGTDDLKEGFVDCPTEKISRVIGKNGAMMAQIERRTLVQMDIVDGEDGRSRVRLVGSDASLSAAAREIENITLATDEKLELSAALCTYLLAKRGAVLNRARQNNPAVQFDLTERVLHLHGRPEFVSIAKEEILNTNVARATLTTATRQIGQIVGKSGANVNKLEADFDVSINFLTNDGSGESTIEIVGIASNVDAAHAALREIVYQTEDVEETILVQQPVRNMFLDKNGAVLKEIQAEIGGSRLYFDKRPEDSAGDSGSFAKSPSNLVILTRRSSIVEAKKLVLDRIDAFESSIVTISIDPNIIPQIIGKGGATIRELEACGASIDVDKENRSITIQSNDEETRNAVKTRIEAIVAENQVELIEIDKPVIGAFFGEPGKVMRKTCSEEIGANVSLNQADTHVVIKGTVDQIEKAAGIVRIFLENNFVEEVGVALEDESFLFQGGQNNILSRLERDHNVSASLIRSKHFVSIRGKEEAVGKATASLTTVLYGGNGHVVLKVPIPGEDRGIIVGKEGSQLKKLEAEFDGVTVTLLRTSNVLVIRGEEEQANKCRSRVCVLLATATKFDRMSLLPHEFNEISKPGVTRDISEVFGVQISLDHGAVKMRGYAVNLRDAKAKVIELVTGKYSSYIPLEMMQVTTVKNALVDSEHFLRINEASKATVSLDEDENEIKIEGKRSSVKKAKFLLLKFLDSQLPSQFSKVTLPKQAVKTVGDTAVLARISADHMGTFLWLDRDLSCVHVRSTEPDQITAAVLALRKKLVECDKCSCVIQLEPCDSWIMPKIIGKGGSIIHGVRQDSGCSVYASDLTLTLSGEEESVAEAKRLLENIIEESKRECSFVQLPEIAMTSFIGKAGANVKVFEKEHEVEIERIQGNRSLVRIQGDEDKVQLAVKAVEAWVSEWEATNSITTVAVKHSPMMAAIVGKGGSIVRQLEQDTACKIHVDRDSMNVTIAGNEGGRAEAERRILKILEEEQTKFDARAAERERSAPTAAVGALAVHENVAGRDLEKKSMRNVGSTPGIAAKQIDDSRKFPTVPVGVAVKGYDTLYSDNRRKSSDAAEISPSGVFIMDAKPNPHVTAAGKELLKFLCSDDMDSTFVFSQDAQPKSKSQSPALDQFETLSAVTASTSSDGSDADVDISEVSGADGVGEVIEGGYYRSTSGFVVRI